jgi:nitric oxide reductase NorQ protein
MIAKTLKVQKLTPARANKVFMQMCQDILASETSRVGSKTNQDRVKQIVRELVAKELGISETANFVNKTSKDGFTRADSQSTIEQGNKQKEKSLIEV